MLPPVWSEYQRQLVSSMVWCSVPSIAPLFSSTQCSTPDYETCHFVSNKRGRSYQGMLSLLVFHFLKKCSNIFIFGCCGGNVSFFMVPKFQDPTQPPTWKRNLQSFFWTFSWHMRIRALSSKKGGWPTLSTCFTHTDSGITEIREFNPIKHSYITFILYPSPLLCIFILISVISKKQGERSWVLKLWHLEEAQNQQIRYLIYSKKKIRIKRLNNP